MLIWVHLLFALISDVLLMMTAAISTTYLVQDHLLKTNPANFAWLPLPSISRLDDLSLKFLTLSFVFMTVGILSGSVMAMREWGELWYLDARQLWSTGIWLLLGLVLIGRFTVGWRGKRAQWITLVGAFMAIVGLLLLNYFSWTKHLNAGVKL